MNSLNENIRKRYNSLTKKQKQVAQYLLENTNEVALMTARAIGAETNTSETTVIRLCYELGYSGYSELQEEIRQVLLQPNIEDPLKKYREKTQYRELTDVLKGALELDSLFIKKTLMELNSNFYARIVESISKANKIIVVGFRSSLAPAYWLSFTLNMIRGNVHLFHGDMDDANYLISEMNNSTLVVAFSFPRYTKSTISFAKASKSKNATVLAITDHALSPIGKYCDLLLKIHTPTPTALKGMAIIFSVLNIIVTGVASMQKEITDQRLEQYESSTLQFDPFV